MAQWWKTLAAPVEDQVLTPSICMVAYNSVELQFQGIQGPFLVSTDTRRAHGIQITRRQNSHTQKISKSKSDFFKWSVEHTRLISKKHIYMLEVWGFLL